MTSSSCSTAFFGFVHANRATIKLFAMQARDGFLYRLGISYRHKTKASASACFAIQDHLRIEHLSESLERGSE